METTYCLSPGFTFLDQATLANSNSAAGLLNHETGEVLLLNAETATLLTVFRQSASIADAARLFAPTVDAPVADLLAVVASAVDTFVQRSILIPTDYLPTLLATHFPMAQPGAVIGGYRVLRTLSVAPPVGVYLVRNRAGRRYVLKTLVVHPKASRAVGRAQRQEFAREFALLDRLRGCVGVGRLTGFDAKAGIGVIPYFAGLSLRKFLHERADTLSNGDRLALFAQLVNAVAGLHRRQVLHGDLHYDNVLISRQKLLRLIDFDLAFAWPDRHRTKPAYGGITDFMPPERLTDDLFQPSVGPPDFRAEVYQVGVLGYFIFHNKLPFAGQTWRGLLAAIRHQPLNWEVPDASPVIRYLIETALDRNPASRFESAIPIKVALRQYQAGL